MRKSKNPPPTFLNQDPKTSQVEVEDLLQSIDDQFEVTKKLIKELSNLLSDSHQLKEEVTVLKTDLAKSLNEAMRIKNEVSSFKFSADLSSTAKKELEVFFEQQLLTNKELIRSQFADCVRDNHALLNEFQKRTDELLQSQFNRQKILLEQQTKMFAKNKGVWASDRNFWLIIIIIAILLSATTWFVGQALTK